MFLTNFENLFGLILDARAIKNWLTHRGTTAFSSCSWHSLLLRYVRKVKKLNTKSLVKNRDVGARFMLHLIITLMH
jgi:hypothetical protein